MYMRLKLLSFFYLGLEVWSRWLPKLAISLIAALVLMNLSSFDFSLIPGLNLSPLYSKNELLFYSLSLPLLFSKGLLFVLPALLFHTLFKVLNVDEHSLLAGHLLILGSLTVLALTWDRLGTCKFRDIKRQTSLQTFRLFKFQFVLLTFVGIATFLGLNSDQVFHKLSPNLEQLGIFISPVVLTIYLLLNFTGWVLASIGYSRNLLLFFLSAPTILLASLTTKLPNFFFVVLLSSCIALVITTTDRRELARPPS